MACVIDSERLRNSNNSIPVEQHTFQSAAALLPTSLGRAGKEIATLQTGSHHFVLISVRPANLCIFCAMLARIGGFVNRLDNAHLVNSIPYSPQLWGRMSRSIWPNIGH